MVKPATLVLLPGLDGTEVFFRPLLAALPPAIRPHVVRFPVTGSNEYADLLAIVREAVASIPHCFVLGWSFSGPLALMLAATDPARVRGVILVSTFVRSPRPLLSHIAFAAVTPVIWMIRAGLRLPVWFFRQPADPFRRDKAETWTRVSARTIAARVRAILRLDAREALRRCPHAVLYIAGRHDNVVPRSAVNEIVRTRPSVHVRVIEGRHFALYTNPDAVADTVRAFIAQREPAS
jgi:pimeloyl-ACP methyl ester carboxylesterase